MEKALLKDKGVGPRRPNTRKCVSNQHKSTYTCKTSINRPKISLNKKELLTRHTQFSPLTCVRTLRQTDCYRHTEWLLFEKHPE